MARRQHAACVERAGLSGTKDFVVVGAENGRRRRQTWPLAGEVDRKGHLLQRSERRMVDGSDHAERGSVGGIGVDLVEMPDR